MKVKECCRCYRHLGLDEFYKDRYQKDGLTSACKRCRSKQIWEAYKRRTNPQEDPIKKQYKTLEYDNLKALESVLINRKEDRKPLVIKTRIVGAILPIPEGLVIRGRYAVIETRSGRISMDLSGCSPKEFVEQLARKHIKIEP